MAGIVGGVVPPGKYQTTATTKRRNQINPQTAATLKRRTIFVLSPTERDVRAALRGADIDADSEVDNSDAE